MRDARSDAPYRNPEIEFCQLGARRTLSGESKVEVEATREDESQMNEGHQPRGISGVGEHLEEHSDDGEGRDYSRLMADFGWPF